MPTTVETKMVPTVDGRELCVEVAGAESAASVLVCGGMPNSRHLREQWISDAAERNLQLIGYDRPGYGGSTVHSGRSVADGVTEVQAIAEHLGIDRLAVWGFSAGGPYALACAALLPDLVVAAATVGSPAPWAAPGLDYFTGMGEDNVEDIQLMLTDREKARAKAHQDWEDIRQVTPEQLLEAWKSLLAPVDAAVLTGEFAESVVRSIQDGLAPGDQGWWDDGLAQLAPWGFDLTDIRIPVKIWHGRHDRFVPFQHGQWLAGHVPGAQAELSETEGHLSLLVDVGQVHAWLLGHL
jgi:pimeloyl-ACP methyl ester carboxylesterase